jgi:hypothetical protein
MVWLGVIRGNRDGPGSPLSGRVTAGVQHFLWRVQPCFPSFCWSLCRRRPVRLVASATRPGSMAVGVGVSSRRRLVSTSTAGAAFSGRRRGFTSTPLSMAVGATATVGEVISGPSLSAMGAATDTMATVTAGAGAVECTGGRHRTAMAGSAVSRMAGVVVDRNSHGPVGPDGPRTLRDPFAERSYFSAGGFLTVA